jgi:heptosyltransferase-1
MPDILFIKTSSLGDVIHFMPALTEARRQLAGARLSWLVEEAYAPLLRLHPAVDEVMAVATRRWRRAPFAVATWSEIQTFKRALRAQPYDLVVDAQGLLRSAIMARVARGVRHGYSAGSIREPLASAFYNVRHAVSRSLHAIERNRELVAKALGYATGGPLDYGLDVLRAAVPTPYAVLLHASARAEKEWPEDRWIAVGAMLQRRGLTPVLPWGTEREGARSARIAEALPGADVPRRQPLDAVARLIAGASLVVGVDTGILHLAAALKVPLVAIFSGSEPTLTAPMGAGEITVLGTKGAPPSASDVIAAIERTLGTAP